MTDKGWTTHAKAMEETGATALELDVCYVPADLETTRADVEQRCIDLAKMAVSPNLKLSSTHEAQSSFLWIGVLSRHVQASIVAMTDVHQVIKFLLAGADAVMTTFSPLRESPQHMADLLHCTARWMHDRDYTQVDQIRGALS